MSDTYTYDIAELFKVLGDSTRARMISALEDRELCVCDLAQHLSMTESAISHQLRILKQARLVSNRRDGKHLYYSLADHHVAVLFDTALEHIKERNHE
jgi:ArsR family transcriptional regulator